MHIGILDSGFEGLYLLKALATALPQYDYLYYADTAARAREVADVTYMEAVNEMVERGCAAVLLVGETFTPAAVDMLQAACFDAQVPVTLVHEQSLTVDTVETYLQAHPEITAQLSHTGARSIVLTEQSETYDRIIAEYLGGSFLPH